MYVIINVLSGELGRLYTLGHGRELDFNLALRHLQRGAEALDRCVCVCVCKGCMWERGRVCGSEGGCVCVYVCVCVCCVVRRSILLCGDSVLWCPMLSCPLYGHLYLNRYLYMPFNV